MLEDKVGEPHSPEVTRDTYMDRGTEFIRILRTEIIPSGGHPRILIVGGGLDREDGTLQCSYEPFRVASVLEASGIDYSMTVVDIDPNVIEDIRSRKKLFFAGSYIPG